MFLGLRFGTDLCIFFTIDQSCLGTALSQIGCFLNYVAIVFNIEDLNASFFDSYNFFVNIALASANAVVAKVGVGRS